MLERIKEIVADQLGIDAEDIKLESNFKEDLEADSLDLFELVMSLEEEYGVEIPSEDLEKILTVNDVIKYLEDKGVEALLCRQELRNFLELNIRLSRVEWPG